jgi:hypothetical protein
MSSPGMLRRVAVVRTDVSEEPRASIIRVTPIGELGTTLTLSLLLFTLMMEPIRSPKRLFLQESHGVTFQKAAGSYFPLWKPQI